MRPDMLATLRCDRPAVHYYLDIAEWRCDVHPLPAPDEAAELFSPDYRGTCDAPKGS